MAQNLQNWNFCIFFVTKDLIKLEAKQLKFCFHNFLSQISERSDENWFDKQLMDAAQLGIG